MEFNASTIAEKFNDLLSSTLLVSIQCQEEKVKLFAPRSAWKKLSSSYQLYPQTIFAVFHFYTRMIASIINTTAKPAAEGKFKEEIGW